MDICQIDHCFTHKLNTKHHFINFSSLTLSELLLWLINGDSCVFVFTLLFYLLLTSTLREHTRPLNQPSDKSASEEMCWPRQRERARDYSTDCSLTEAVSSCWLKNCWRGKQSLIQRNTEDSEVHTHTHTMTSSSTHTHTHTHTVRIWYHAEDK